jgi:hypothetical protein
MKILHAIRAAVEGHPSAVKPAAGADRQPR